MLRLGITIYNLGSREESQGHGTRGESRQQCEGEALSLKTYSYTMRKNNGSN